MKGIKKFFILTVTVVFCFSSNANAAEIKIFDELGLERAYSKIKDHGTVIIHLSPSGKVLPDSIMLTHLDGLSPDRQIIMQGGGTYRSEEVGPGSWKIILPDQTLTVKEVKIIE